MHNIKYIDPKDIDKKAQQTLNDYYQRYGTKLPFKAEQFLETKFGITIIPLPGLKPLEVMCGLSADASTVIVDQEAYHETEARKYSAVRFSFAHEVAHMILHKILLPNTPPHNYEELTSFLGNFDVTAHNRIETQANMFAARFIMPTRILLGFLASRIVENIDLLTDNNITVQDYAKFIAPQLATEFGVSQGAMINRLNKLDYSELTDSSRPTVLIAECDVEVIRALSQPKEEQVNNWGANFDAEELVN